MLERISLKLKQHYNSFVGDDITADQHEREAALIQLKDFIDKEAARNEKGELSSANVDFEISRYGILSHEDVRDITEYAKSKGLDYYHRDESVFRHGRYQDARTIKSHVIGDQFAKSPSEIPFKMPDNLSQADLRRIRLNEIAAGNLVTAEQYERQWAMRKLKAFIDKQADKNERGQLSSARVNFEISRSGIISREDEAELAAYARGKGISYYHKDEQVYRWGRYQDEATVKSHVIGDQFGKDLS